MVLMSQIQNPGFIPTCSYMVFFFNMCISLSHFIHRRLSTSPYLCLGGHTESHHSQSTVCRSPAPSPLACLTISLAQDQYQELQRKLEWRRWQDVEMAASEPRCSFCCVAANSAPVSCVCVVIPGFTLRHI